MRLLVVLSFTLGATRLLYAQETDERSFEQAYEAWVTSKEGKVSEPYLRELRSAWGFWKPFFGNRRLSEITPELIDEYLVRRSRGTVPRRATGRRLSAATINSVLSHSPVALRRSTRRPNCWSWEARVSSYRSRRS